MAKNGGDPEILDQEEYYSACFTSPNIFKKLIQLLKITVSKMGENLFSGERKGEEGRTLSHPIEWAVRRTTTVAL